MDSNYFLSGIRRTKKENHIYNDWRRAELLSAIFSCFGIVTSSIDYEERYSDNRTHHNCETDEGGTYRWLTLCTSLIAIAFLLLRYYKKKFWHRYRPTPFADLSQSHSLNYRKLMKNKRKFFSWELVFEILMSLIFPYPNLEAKVYIRQEENKIEENGNTVYDFVCYNISELLYVVMFLRIFFILRAIFNSTPYENDHARIYCSRHRISANVRFSVKCMMKTSPFLMIFCFFIPVLFIFGCFMRVFERPFTDISGLDFKDYFNSVWCCAVTMATIGYGDFYPETHLGRIVAIGCGVCGFIVFSMVVFVFETNLLMNKDQNKSFKEISISKKAIRAVEAALRLNLILCRDSRRSEEAKEERKVLDKRIMEWKETVRWMRNLYSKRDEAVESLQYNFKVLKQEVSQINNKLDYIISKVG